MYVKEIFIKKSAGFYTGKYIDTNEMEHYIPKAFQCITRFGCRRAMKKWIKKEGVAAEIITF